MRTRNIHSIRGAGWLQEWPVAIALLLAAVGMGGLMGLLNIQVATVLAILPLGGLFMGAVLVRPQIGLWFALVFSFLASGLTRYVDLPWAVLIDVVLFLALIGWGIRQLMTRDWTVVRYDVLLLMALWFVYVLLELFNPESPGLVAWLYAMRGLGFYLLLGSLLAFTYLREVKQVDRFIKVVLGLSILGTLWGLKQQFWGTNAAEDYWLFTEGHHDEHILHGVLRVFSFYSDAGQFGASQAMMALMCGILFLGPFSNRQRLFFAVAGLLTFLGFLYSGTRGALAVPLAGSLVYMVLSKNFKILLIGFAGLVLAFGLLKYTYVMHSFQPVARLRTALSADNPSLQARLRNQATLATYLADRPIGGGVGSAGYWGERFQPGTLLARTPTDSYYVRIWAETGIVGLSLHLFLLGYILGKGGMIIWRLRHPRLRTQMLAILSAYGGVLLANYGNQVFLQFPTGLIMAVGLPMVFLAPEYDEQLMQSENE